MMIYVFEGCDFPGFSQLSVYSHKGLVYSHKGKTRDVLKGNNLADYGRSINDAISFERTNE